MTTISPINIGLSGIQRGINTATNSAQTIANASLSGDSSTQTLAEPMVELLQSRNQVAASAKVVEAGSEMIGTIIDIMA